MPAAPIGSLRRDSEFGCGAGTSVDALEDSVDSARLCSPTPRRASDGSSLNMISPVRPRTLFLRQRSGSSFSPSTSPRAPDSSCDGGAGLPKRASVGDLPRLKTSMTSPGCMVYVAGAGGGAGAGGAAGAAAGLRLRRSQSMGNVAETLVQHASQESIDVEDELSEYPCDPPMRVPSRVLDPSMNVRSAIGLLCCLPGCLSSTCLTFLRSHSFGGCCSWFSWKSLQNWWLRGSFPSKSPLAQCFFMPVKKLVRASLELSRRCSMSQANCSGRVCLVVCLFAFFPFFCSGRVCLVVCLFAFFPFFVRHPFALLGQRTALAP